MSVRQSRAIAGAVALFAFAAVVLEVALVRMYSVLLGKHFGVFWVIVLPLGIGLGAFLGLPSLARHWVPFRAAPVAHLAALAAPSAAISVIFGIRAKHLDAFDQAALQQFLIFFGTSLLPFVFAGLVFARVLGASHRNSAALLRTILSAAACGLVAAAFVMRFGPARVGLGVAVALSVSALLFARAAKFDTEGHGASGSFIATFILGTSVVLAGEIGAPYLKLATPRWAGIDKAETQIWTAQGFYYVDKPQSNSALLRVDSTFARSIPDGKQIPPLAVDELAYLLDKGKDPVLVVGAGGGREIRAALRQTQRDVQAVEEDITIGRAIMRGSSYAFSEELYDKPEVHVALGGAKNYVRRHPDTYQRIVLGYVDTQAAAPFGALSAISTPWLTTEFVQDLLGALQPDGTLTIQRPETELERVLALVARSLRARGSRAPGMHVFGCSKDKLAAVVVKRTPYMSDELSTLRTHCRRHKFVEVVSPDAVREEPRKSIVAGVDPRSLPAGQTLDLSAPTEDRPFWYYTQPPKRMVAAWSNIRELIDHQRTALVIGAGVVLTMLLGLAVWLFSTIASGRTWGYASRISVTRMSLTFASIVIAIVWFGSAVVGRIESVVGRPDIAGLFLPLAYLFAIGLGAAFAARFDLDDARAGLQRWVLATTFVLAPVLMALDGIISVIVDLPLLVRIAVPAILLGIVGAGLGIGLGLAVRIAASWGVRVLASALAYAGIGAAWAMLVGTCTAMNAGYSAELLASAAAMMAAIVFAASARPEMPSAAIDFRPLSTSDTELDDEPISMSEPEAPSAMISP